MHKTSVLLSGNVQLLVSEALKIILCMCDAIIGNTSPKASIYNAAQKGKADNAALSLYNELSNEIARLEWRVSPEPLRPSAPPHWVNLTMCYYAPISRVRVNHNHI